MQFQYNKNHYLERLKAWSSALFVTVNHYLLHNIFDDHHYSLIAALLSTYYVSSILESSATTIIQELTLGYLKILIAFSNRHILWCMPIFFILRHQFHHILDPHPINIIVNCKDLYVHLPGFYLYPWEDEEPFIKPVTGYKNKLCSLTYPKTSIRKVQTCTPSDPAHFGEAGAQISFGVVEFQTAMCVLFLKDRTQNSSGVKTNLLSLNTFHASSSIYSGTIMFPTKTEIRNSLSTSFPTLCDPGASSGSATSNRPSHRLQR